jgi:hypothetical protein
MEMFKFIRVNHPDTMFLADNDFSVNYRRLFMGLSNHLENGTR